MLLKDRSAVRRGYPLIWLSLALRSEGQDPAALETTYPGDQLSSDWPRPLVDMAVGKASMDAAIVAAKAAKNPAESLCEAYFYIGEKYFAEGNLKRATEFWRKSVDQGVTGYTEHRAAVLRLGAVGAR
jgi:lipoprotein NlpI